ncbi:MAG TPA: heat-inducible transcriptional repressor HrcA [Actinomycetota bacterium]|nr:heat-inducible transcriptional repressor HrcA [Actinomycetota bacterium]
MVEPELGTRKVAVLRAVVEEYVRSGEPVGSETIAEGSHLGVSSATIRNEMAALEELGYLTHPHTSAGRIPTDAGYRKYVDALPPGGKLRDQQRRAIAGFFAETMLDLEDVLRGTTQLLSKVTQYAGLAVPPSGSEDSVLRVELIEVGTAVMVLVVGQHGGVGKLLIERPDGLRSGDLRGFERRFAERFAGKPIAEAQAVALRTAAESPGAERELLLGVSDVLASMQAGARAHHIVVGGVANLADEAAHWRRETVRRLFEALERESEMLHLLRDVTAEDVSVTIGAEHPATGDWEASLVSAPFRAGDTALGTIGVVGPTAMDYVSVMASVRAVARRLSELATELGA